MEPFCDNEYCPQHEFEAAPKTDILRNDKLITMSRHKVKDSIYLCACCYNVYLMVKDDE